MHFNKQRVALVMAGSAILGASVGAVAPAFAGTAYSTVGAFTVAGTNYTNQAYVITSTGKVSAVSEIDVASGSVPAGWMGARGRLFNAAGTLIQESATAYTSVTASGLGVPTVRTGTGTWNSYGVTYSWNGSSYSPYYTFRSPNQTS